MRAFLVEQTYDTSFERSDEYLFGARFWLPETEVCDTTLGVLLGGRSIPNSPHKIQIDSELMIPAVLGYAKNRYNLSKLDC